MSGEPVRFSLVVLIEGILIEIVIWAITSRAPQVAFWFRPAEEFAMSGAEWVGTNPPTWR